MYPAELLNLFPPFPKTNMVFVAMSFDPKFMPRWTNVLCSAVHKVVFKDKELFPHRVDLSKKNDSVITEIVKNISECCLFIGDVSTNWYLFIEGEQGKPIRNSNVLYEVGLAHACRLPEEVILLRSDNDVLDFDIAGVRVHSYDPDNVETSIEMVADLIVQALSSVDDKKRILVENTTKLLDAEMFSLLHETKDIPQPIFRTMLDVPPIAERISAINRMLGLGLLQTIFNELTPEIIKGPFHGLLSYRITSFGKAVLGRIKQKTDSVHALSVFAGSEDGKEWLAKQSKEK